MSSTRNNLNKPASKYLDATLSLQFYNIIQPEPGTCIKTSFEILKQYPYLWLAVGYFGKQQYNYYKITAHCWVFDFERSAIIDALVPGFVLTYQNKEHELLPDMKYIKESFNYFSGLYIPGDFVVSESGVYIPSGRSNTMKVAATAAKEYSQQLGLKPSVRHWKENN